MNDLLFRLLFCGKDDWLWWSQAKCFWIFSEDYRRDWDAQKEAA